jgi:hypothetical protein
VFLDWPGMSVASGVVCRCIPVLLCCFSSAFCTELPSLWLQKLQALSPCL